jgi:hypothetical protein
MDEEILDALIELKGAVQKQTSLQEQTNKLLQVLINVLQQSGQAMSDLIEAIDELGPMIDKQSDG